VLVLPEAPDVAALDLEAEVAMEGLWFNGFGVGLLLLGGFGYWLIGRRMARIRTSGKA
jgi:hypothetical protein